MDEMILYFTAISILSFLLFGLDKQKAKQNKRRISEFVFLLLSFLGGSVGSLLGMLVFRHKISKTSFKIKFGLIFLVQILVIFYYVTKKKKLTAKATNFVYLKLTKVKKVKHSAFFTFEILVFKHFFCCFCGFKYY